MHAIHHNLFPDMKDSMHLTAAAAYGGADHGFMLLRIEHFDAHVDDISRREVLAFSFDMISFKWHYDT